MLLDVINLKTTGTKVLVLAILFNQYFSQQHCSIATAIRNTL